jgi:F-type H+-transporting ATPase subunit b
VMKHTALTLLFLLILLCPAGLSSSTGHRKAVSLLESAVWSAGPEHAEEGGGHENLYHWINFILLAVALVYLGRKPLGAFFAQRSESVRKALEEGRKALEASQAQLKAVEEKLLHLEQEIAAFKASALREMEAERERLRQAAAAEAEKIRDFTRVQMDVALRAAKLELKNYAVLQAIEQAEAMIRQRLDDAGRSRLFGRFLAGLEAKERKN